MYFFLKQSLPYPSLRFISSLPFFFLKKPIAYCLCYPYILKCVNVSWKLVYQPGVSPLKKMDSTQADNPCPSLFYMLRFCLY